jgi:OmpA-like transmembrane domain
VPRAQSDTPSNAAYAVVLLFHVNRGYSRRFLGAYVGAALGEAHVRSEELRSGETTPFTFDESHCAWKIVAGARPLSVFGVELAYSDFGNVSAPPPGIFSYFNAQSKQNAATAFGIGYLPLPVPHLDLYGKLGVARLHAQSQLGPDGAAVLF